MQLLVGSIDSLGKVIEVLRLQDSIMYIVHAN